MVFDDPTVRRDYDAVVPLINVVFLLLVFFLLAGTLEPLDPVTVDLPEGRMDDAAAGDATMLYIGADGIIWRDDQAMDARIAANGLRGAQAVAIKADAAAPAEALLALMQALRNEGVDEVTLVTAPSREGK